MIVLKSANPVNDECNKWIFKTADVAVGFSDLVLALYDRDTGILDSNYGIRLHRCTFI